MTTSSSEQTVKPRLLEWTTYLGYALLASLPLSVVMVRAGIWQQGLMLYALACLGATVLLILCVILWLLPKYNPLRGKVVTTAALMLPGTVLLLSMFLGRGDYPAIHDITTDTIDPPLFASAAERRPEGSNALEIVDEVIAQQNTAYPDVKTITSSLAMAEAFARALEIADALGWEVVNSDADAGLIEAVDTTAIMGFKDDIVIRLRGTGDTTLVDLRSVSRVGVSDLGANAIRIRAFQSSFGG